MLTFLILAIGLEWWWNLQPYRPSRACEDGSLMACPDLLAWMGHYFLVPLAVPWLIVAINLK